MVKQIPQLKPKISTTKKAFQFPERLWWEMIPMFKSGRPPRCKRDALNQLN